MTTIACFSRETDIYVSTSLKLNVEQTQSVTCDLLKLLGYPSTYHGFKFHFIDEGDLVQANASVDDDLKVVILN